jgi:hypothetical protein
VVIIRALRLDETSQVQEAKKVLLNVAATEAFAVVSSWSL